MEIVRPTRPYPLGKAMADGFVKEPAMVTRKNFNPAGMPHEAIERMKLMDGIRLHESVKVELETYARETMGILAHLPRSDQRQHDFAAFGRDQRNFEHLIRPGNTNEERGPGIGMFPATAARTP